MARVVTLSNGKNITLSVATDESLYKSLSYYIQKELGDEFCNYLESYVRSLIEENNNLKEQLVLTEDNIGELRYEKEEVMQFIREAYSLIIDGDLNSAQEILEQILNY